jgi:hypothetical protein
VWIDGQEPLHLLLPRLLAPRLSPGEEEPLGPAQAVEHRRGRASEREQVGLPGDGEAAEVADVLADRQCSVHVQFGRLARRERVVLVDQDPGPLLEGRAVRRLPPVGQSPRAVELRALVVEAVADLVADYRPDRTVVGGLVAIGVEEGRLQDGRRKDDLVQTRVVVGVDRLGRYQPLVAVDPVADCTLAIRSVGSTSNDE